MPASGDRFEVWVDRSPDWDDECLETDDLHQAHEWFEESLEAVFDDEVSTHPTSSVRLILLTESGERRLLRQAASVRIARYWFVWDCARSVRVFAGEPTRVPGLPRRSAVATFELTSEQAGSIFLVSDACDAFEEGLSHRAEPAFEMRNG